MFCFIFVFFCATTTNKSNIETNTFVAILFFTIDLATGEENPLKIN
jgi:hypothetical protein